MFSAETFQALGVLFTGAIAVSFIVMMLFVVKDGVREFLQDRDRNRRMERRIEQLEKRVEALEVLRDE